MVPVRVLGVAIDAEQQPVVLLTPLDTGGRARTLLPIWVGPQEATSISMAVSGDDPPRPLAHDLMQRLLVVLGATVERVDVTRLDAGVFYAELTVASVRGRTTIDCRPSDAIALAARTGSPLFVAEAVLATAGVLEDDGGAAEPVRTEEQLDEFRRFLDGVDPEDFQG